MECDKCKNTINRGMAGSEHSVSTYEDNGDIININRNGVDVQARMAQTKDDITLEIEGDIFIITKEDLMAEKENYAGILI